MGNRKLSEISAWLGVKQTNVPKYLKTLMDMDLAEREVPVTEDLCNSSLCSFLHQLIESQIQRGKDLGSGVQPGVQVHAGV